MALKKHLFTSESVAPGHPDKVADTIADALLDEVIKKDEYGRVACEVFVGMGYVIVGGEISTKAWININNVVRNVIREIGYDKPEYGFDYHTVAIFNTIHEQSPDIAQGVKKTASKEQGAGDQGMVVGYACRETKELMPLPITLAHGLVTKLSEARKRKLLPYLRPDGKSQVTLEYEKGIPQRVDSVVMGAQHDPGISLKKIKADIIEKIVRPVCGRYLDKKTRYYINNTGRFVIGGPVSDSGMTGRKIVVDSYGGVVPVGGGSFSGKDPTKVDRSGAYLARYIAKNIVAARLAERCLVRLAYVIGSSKPSEVSLDAFGTAKVSEEKLLKAVEKVFDLSPGGIIKELDLLRPIYKKTSCCGHFGRAGFAWEKTDKVKVLQKLL